MDNNDKMPQSFALVRDSDGLVATLLRPDLPAGYAAPAGFHLEPADQLPAGWQRIPPTQEELDAQADLALRAQIRAAITDMKAGNGTAAERLQRLEKATAWLLQRELQKADNGQ